jgi:hypothetical protein
VIDFAKILADPADPFIYQKDLTTDFTHPSEAGTLKMGNGIDLSLFTMAPSSSARQIAQLGIGSVFYVLRKKVPIPPPLPNAHETRVPAPRPADCSRHASALRAQRGTDEHIAFVGAYTRTTGKGIQAWRFKPSTATSPPPRHRR